MRFTLILCTMLALSMIFTPLINLKETSVTSSAVSASVKEEQEEEKITLLLSEKNEEVTLTMRDYLFGVLAAEITPLYADEAIKAQAVASHTYALYQTKNNVTLTDDFTHHQAYISKEEATEKWGDKYDIYAKKITSLIDEVIDKTITYDGEIILPAFFALCSGKTENSEDIWGGKTPYLVSVDSEGDLLNADLTQEEAFTKEDFVKFTGITFEDAPVISIDTTASGAVKKMTVNEKSFTGNEIQSAFSLKSNNFTLKYDGEKFLFTVTGNGHGVGMSQYGADFMARQGATYEEILKHYYTGVEITSI